MKRKKNLKVRQLIAEKGFLHQEVAEKVGKTTPFISEVLAGRKKGTDTKVAICSLLDAPLNIWDDYHDCAW